MNTQYDAMRRAGSITMTIDGADYVVVPKAEYQALIGEPDADLATTAATLRAARTHAGLTQADLADKLKVGQGHISNCEAGRERVGAKLVGRWLKACHLPADWKPVPAP